MSEWFERVLDVNRDVTRSIGNRLSYTKVNPSNSASTACRPRWPTRA